jgi:hypothetical protein
MSEDGVTVIDGSDSKPRSRSSSPVRKPGEEDKPKKFLNGWSKEQEELMSEWSDYAMCYRWIHDKSEKFFHGKNRWINIPVIILSTLGGTANFGIQSVFSDNASKQYASFIIGGISLFAGLLTTIGNYLRYAQFEESHRVASISWGKFQRQVAVELALDPNERIDAMDFLKICRTELDRLIEQSPPIPEDSIKMFEEKFGDIKGLKKPDICGSLEHTRIFASSNSRLKQLAVESALMLKHKRNALNELLSPQIQETIRSQVESKLHDALEERKKDLEEEIERKKIQAIHDEEAMRRTLEDRKQRINEEIELEKKKATDAIAAKATAAMDIAAKGAKSDLSGKKLGSTFANKSYFMRNNIQRRGSLDGMPIRSPREEPKEPQNIIITPAAHTVNIPYSITDDQYDKV